MYLNGKWVRTITLDLNDLFTQIPLMMRPLQGSQTCSVYRIYQGLVYTNGFALSVFNSIIIEQR